MREALKKQTGIIVTGLILTALAAGAVYWFDRTTAKVNGTVRALEQADRVADRLKGALSELDATSAFIVQSDSALHDLSNFVSRLTISKLGQSRWLLAAQTDATRLSALQNWTRTTFGRPDFTLLPSPGTTAPLPVILALGPHADASAGVNISPVSYPLTTASNTHIKILKMSGQLGEDRVIWLATENTPSVTPPLPYFDSLLLIRGVDLSTLSSIAGLQRQGLDVILSPRHGNGELLFQPTEGGASSTAVERTLDLDNYQARLRLDLPANEPIPYTWVIFLLAGIALTAFSAAWRAGLIVSDRAQRLSTALAHTRTELSVTSRKESAFFDNTGTANCEVDATTAMFLRVNEACCHLLGYSRDELLSKSVFDVTHADDVQATQDFVRKGEEQGDGLLQFEKRYVRKDGTTIWGLVSTKYFEDPEWQQKIFLTTIVDITTRKQDEIVKNNLVRELAHRVRNTMQLAASLARQSSRNARSIADYDEKFRSRLAALNSAQDLLFDSAWRSADLRQIAERTLLPFKSDRVEVSLPSIELPTQHAQTFAIAVHELASNAMQFGALRDGGIVSFTGKVGPDPLDGQEKLHLLWTETGERRRVRHYRAGFGQTVLETALPEQFSGRAKTNLTSSGFAYEAWLSIPSLG